MAAQVGLDMAKWTACIADPSIAQAVKDETAAGQQLGVKGTPALFVNGTALRSYDYATISTAIEAALATASPAASPSASASASVSVARSESVSPNRLGPVLVALAAIGLAISAYLTWTKVSGVPPICGPGGGCETVENSSYSSIFGIPVALLGMGYSATVLVAVLAWWRGGRREGILVAYGLGLVGTLVEVYLVYLELFVIHAICIWCVAYGATVVLGWLGALLAVRRSA